MVFDPLDLERHASRPNRLTAEGIAQAANALGVGPADATVSPFLRAPLYPKQAAIVDDPARFTVTEASPKAGKTMSHIEWWLDRGSKRGFGNSWWVATVSSVANIAFRRTLARLRGYLDSGHGPIRISDPYPFIANKSERFIEAFGVTFWFKSADEPDTLYGDDVYDAVGDEITRWKEAAWEALYTTLVATRGHAKLIGNVKGRKNFAYRLARKAEAGEPNWAYHKLTAWDAIQGGVIDKEVVEQARRDLTPERFAELFEATAASDEGNPFGIDIIHRQSIASLAEGPVVAWGWDLAKSVDWTVGIGLNASGQVARLERFQRSWADTERVIIDDVNAFALIDSTGVGDPVVESMQMENHHIEGFKFSPSSKQQILEGLAAALHRGEVWPVAGWLTNELEAIEYEYTRTGVRYAAPEGMHDDGVMALALAVEALRRLALRPRISVWVPGFRGASR